MFGRSSRAPKRPSNFLEDDSDQDEAISSEPGEPAEEEPSTSDPSLCPGNSGRVDAGIVRQLEAECNYWKEVLKRIAAVIRFLAESGLPFRGKDELLGSAHNGNYLGVLELVAQFDPFLSDHIAKVGQKGEGYTSYLSSTTCEEFIELMGEKVKKTIAAELKNAKYFSVIIESTPDLPDVDQLTFIFRFVNSEGKVIERFLGFEPVESHTGVSLGFEPIESHTGVSLADRVLTMISDLGLELSNCRGLSYDNASNMSGRYNGVQAHLKRQNPLIYYLPCAARSLNSAAVNAVEDSCENAMNFFGFLQSLYSFCAASTYRWNKVLPNDNRALLSLKSLSDTRWSCRADSTRVLCQRYSEIREALESMSEDTNQSLETQRDAASLHSKMGHLETAFLAQLWDTVLQRFEMTSVQLQKSDMDLQTAVRLMESLESFVASLRHQFQNFEKSATSVPDVCKKYQHEMQQMRKKKTVTDDSNEPTTAFEGGDKFRVETFDVLIDRLLGCLNHRLAAYKLLNDRFGVLFENVSDSELSDVRKRATELALVYPNDLDDYFADELIQFRYFVQDEPNKSPARLLQILGRHGLYSTFPNVFIALRLFLTLPVTNCEGERSFSLMARVRNELRSTMRQKRLCALSLMAIESELMGEMDFEDIIMEFARRKSRRKLMV